MNVATWSAKIIERPDGLILRSDQTHLPDCNHVLRMLVKHREIRMLSRGAYARCSTIDELPPWGRFDLDARSVGSTRGRILAGYSPDTPRLPCTDCGGISRFRASTTSTGDPREEG